MGWIRWEVVKRGVYAISLDAPEDVRLLFAFSQDAEGRSTARLYLNELGRQPLDYKLAGEGLRVLSNGGFPYITLTTQEDPGFQPGRPISISVSPSTAFGGHFSLDTELMTDGVIDYQVTVRGRGRAPRRGKPCGC